MGERAAGPLLLQGSFASSSQSEVRWEAKAYRPGEARCLLPAPCGARRCARRAAVPALPAARSVPPRSQRRPRSSAHPRRWFGSRRRSPPPLRRPVVSPGGGGARSRGSRRRGRAEAAVPRGGGSAMALRERGAGGAAEAGEDAAEGPDRGLPLLPWDRFSAWLHCVCVVGFDLELGQAVEVRKGPRAPWLGHGAAALLPQPPPHLRNARLCGAALRPAGIGHFLWGGVAQPRGKRGRVREGTAVLPSAKSQPAAAPPLRPCRAVRQLRAAALCRSAPGAARSSRWGWEINCRNASVRRFHVPISCSSRARAETGWGVRKSFLATLLWLGWCFSRGAR